MLQLTKIVRVDIPVRDRVEAIAFYTETPGRLTGIVLRSADPRADHATLAAADVDVSELIGGDSTIPLLFFVRDPSGNQLMVIKDR